MPRSPFDVLHLLALVVVLATFSSRPSRASPSLSPATRRPNAIRDFLQCRLCNSVKLEGLISDVSGCDFASVNEAVSLFYSPLLQAISTSTFFRYFKVDLEKPCPFWHEDGQCVMEGCSVCTCDERELPQNWLQDYSSAKVRDNTPEGWITSEAETSYGGRVGESGGSEAGDALGRVEGGRTHDATAAPYTQYLQDTEDEDDWTYIDDLEPVSSSGYGYGMGSGGYGAPFPSKSNKQRGVFINLLQNAEGFTGYSGPSAWRVWRAIQEENCFSSQGSEDQCLEKRTFHRLMSGLQASISSHIARSYYYSERKEWGTNVPLFVKAVGSHKDRLVNLYFTFLFLLRAVVKAQPILQAYSYDTGNTTEDALVKDLVLRLTSSSVSLSSLPLLHSRSLDVEAVELLLSRDEEDCSDGEDRGVIANSTHPHQRPRHNSPVERCRHAFNEERLFLVNSTDAGMVGLNGRTGEYGDTPFGKRQLQNEFRERFRNITRIMDCVSCEKCRVWGKLQILGIGTAIKVLLTPAADLSGWGAGGSLSRQEVVALVNTLNQLATSVQFAAEAAELELDEKIGEVGQTILMGSVQGVPFVLAGLLAVYLLTQTRRKKKAE